MTAARSLAQLFVVGAGGFCGAIARYAVAGAVQRLAPAALFPLGTLVVNVAGCLAVGLAAGLADFRGLLAPQTRLFLVLGFLGSFTTFSTFGHETVTLARDSEMLAAAANVVLHVAAGLTAAWLGYAVARAL